MNILTPRKALNKAYLKQKVNREQLEKFKKNFLQMLNHTNKEESEEYHKNLLSTFLNDTWYKGLHFINTKERTDLVIHQDKTADSKPAVLIETKKPDNQYEMPSRENINAKAVHELIRYYLHERIENENSYIKHLIITDLNDFFIFNENDFDKYIYRDKKIRDAYENYKNSGKDTGFFYQSIAQPLIDKIQDQLSFTWFEAKKIKSLLKTNDPEKEKKLIPYLKLLSPPHLLKQPFANDSNTLDRNFYNELLHIIGLQEVNKGSQKLIKRLPEKDRHPGSLLENAITILEAEGILDFFGRKNEYGENRDEQALNIALELIITWINRVLFLKLLEAQLVKYHRNDNSYKFLNTNAIPDYDALNKLFFQVLAVKPSDRNEMVRDKYARVPYLNSSLFDPSELERNTIRISNLEDEYTLPYLKKTVLKDNKGKRRSGELNTLQYLFEFLDAYDFASEGSEDIQEENKNLINASVLGLIFEKINGYKDGSFFTPGFITEYMARETIRRAVVQKYNEAKGWQLEDFEELKEKIDIDKDGRKEANSIINSIKICDPAVGSGHFLVSALNEMIALKSELKVLNYRDESRMKLYKARVENDELIIEDDDEGGIFEYRLSKKGSIIPEKQAVQEAIFHEKQTIIENCLFGVDINPNSVKICRLRLWVELLKNAYYQQPENDDKIAETVTVQETNKPTSNNLELQTLPNIDINIKAGNSLISRFPLNTSLESALKGSRWTIGEYRKYVQEYKNAESKDEKQGLKALIDQIKKNFRTEINRDNPKQKKLNRLVNTLHDKYTGNKLFEDQLTKKQKQDRAKLEKEINKLQDEIDDLKNNEIYRDAFEWRFEFPEVLDDEGNFSGFDLIIGNPPYIRQENFSIIKPYLKTKYQVYNSVSDILTYFIELGYKILRTEGYFIFIISNKFTRTQYGSIIRKFLKTKTNLNKYIDFSGIPVFDEATVDAAILEFQKDYPNVNSKFIFSKIIKNEFNSESINDYINKNSQEIEQNELSKEIWSFEKPKVKNIKQKIENQGIKLENWNIEINYGIKTGYNKAFIISNNTKEKLVEEDPKSLEILKPMLRGRDLKKYYPNFKYEWLINAHNGIKNKGVNPVDIEKDYPAIYKYLSKFKEKLINRSDKGRHWTNLRNCSYIDHFEKPKLIYPIMTKYLPFIIDLDNHFYSNDKTFILNGESIVWLAAFLNSKLFKFCFRDNFPELLGGTRELRKIFFEKIPVKTITSDQEKPIKEKVYKLLRVKQQDPNIDTSAIESEIDQIIYTYYELTEEEKQIIDRETII
jgi:hypothetical protein